MTPEEAYTHKVDGFTFDLSHPSIRLMSLMFSDQRIQELFRDYDLRYIHNEFEEFKEAEAISLIVEIATKYRMMEWNKDMRTFEFETMIVGGLINKATDEDSQLSMKDACNKIVHATHFEFDIEQVDKTKRMWHFNPAIYVHGSFQKNDWAAKVEIDLFCNAANQRLL